MARKYLHPEKLFGVGLTPLDKVVNHLAGVSGKMDHAEMDACFKKLSRKQLEKLKSMIKRDTDLPSREFTYAAQYSMKVGMELIKLKNKIPIYKIGDDFFEVVKSLHRDVPIKNIILKTQSTYLTFKDSKYEGAYVIVYREEGFSIEGDIDIKFTGFKIAFTPKTYDIQGMKTIVFMLFGDNLDISKINLISSQDDIKNNKGDSVLLIEDGKFETEKEIDLIMGVINSMIYINSQDPLIESLKPMRHYTKNELNKLENSKREQLCYFPVKLLNWSYHGRNYSKDETNVKPHLRWQPCGVARADVKLIWVKEHTRTFNQGK